jgi:hypothetical protein
MDSDLMRWVKAQADDPNANPRFRELLVALEAAREDGRDAERYRDMRDKFTWTLTSGEDRYKLTFHMPKIGLVAIGPDDDDFDAAIDQARGKGGQEVGK